MGEDDSYGFDCSKWFSEQRKHFKVETGQQYDFFIFL